MRDLFRTALTWLLVIPATLISTLAFILIDKIDPESPWMDRWARFWARSWLVGIGVKPQVEGQERIDPTGSYVAVSNHQSNLDPEVHFLYFPRPLRFLAKKELFGVPVFGTAIRVFGMIRVDRAHPSKEYINDQVRDAVARGRSIIIYPEGTRSQTGELKPFKKGAFVIAIQTGLPVVPMAIHGTNAIWPPGAKMMHPGPIELVIGDPIPTDGMTLDDAEALRDRVRDWVAKELERLRAGG